MKRPTIAALLVAALLFTACGSDASSGSSASQDVSDESSLPQLTVATVSGGQFEFGSLEGKDTVLWFWAPW